MIIAAAVVESLTKNWEEWVATNVTRLVDFFGGSEWRAKCPIILENKKKDLRIEFGYHFGRSWSVMKKHGTWLRGFWA